MKPPTKSASGGRARGGSASANPLHGQPQPRGKRSLAQASCRNSSILMSPRRSTIDPPRAGRRPFPSHGHGCPPGPEHHLASGSELRSLTALSWKPVRPDRSCLDCCLHPTGPTPYMLCQYPQQQQHHAYAVRARPLYSAGSTDYPIATSALGTATGIVIFPRHTSRLSPCALPLLVDFIELSTIVTCPATPSRSTSLVQSLRTLELLPETHPPPGLWRLAGWIARLAPLLSFVSLRR